jgi:hypothetical protein
VIVRTRLAAAILCALAFLMIGSSSAGALVLGVSDQQPATFSNTWFKKLGVKRTRAFVPYDAVLSARGRARTTPWMNAANGAGQEIVVAFNPSSGSRCPAQPCTLPTKRQFTTAFKAFHAAYPFVRIFQPWNEVNSLTQPTSNHPEAVVSFYAIVKKYCGGCTVLGADLEDLKAGPGVPASIDMVNYTKALLKAFRQAHVPTPQLWGVHNYVDVNYFHSTGTTAALDVLPGKIWLTETGGIAKFTLSSGKVRLPFDLRRQAKATDWVMQLALRYKKRITRVYIYDLFYEAGNRFDSALLDVAGQPRKAYYSLQNHYSNLFN